MDNKDEKLRRMGVNIPRRTHSHENSMNLTIDFPGGSSRDFTTSSTGNYLIFTNPITTGSSYTFTDSSS